MADQNEEQDLLPGEVLKMPVPKLSKGESRMTDAQACRRMVNRMILEDEGRSYRRMLAKGCYDRNPPYTRIQPGFQWACNVNFGQLEGLLDSMRIPYWALFSGAPTYTTFKTNFQRENPETARWESIIEEEWTDLLNRWKQFRWHNKAKEFEMLFEGWGPIIFDSPTDWRFTSIPARCIKVPQGAYSVLDERMPFVVVMRDYRVHELYEKISDESTATEAGWNVPQAKYAIQNACRNLPDYPANQDWEYWQQRLKNADLDLSYVGADVVRCGMVFLKEYARDGKPGKISVFIVTINDVGQPDATDQSKKEGFLYRHVGQYDSYTEALNVYFQNTGDGTWHSVVGAGLKAVKHIEIQNRLMCQQVNGAFLGSTPILQVESSNAQDKMELMLLGPIARMAPGVQLAQNRIAQDLNGPMAVSRMLENSLAQNIGHYNQRSIMRDDGRGEQPTATAVELQASKETALNGAQIENYFDELDITYEEMFRRVMKEPDEEARRFVKRCEDRGVPREALTDMCYVKANRLAGYPSPEMRKRNAREMMGIKGTLPQEGQQAVINEFITAFMGPDKVPVYNPQMQVPDGDAAMAQLENAAMKDGVQPFVVSGMNNAVHLEIHLAFAAEQMEPLREGIEAGETLDPAVMEEAYRYIATLGQHCQVHLDALAQDPSQKALYDQFKLQLSAVAGFHGKLYAAIRQARREAELAALEQQNANALGVMDQAKLQSMQAEQQRKDIEAASSERRKNWTAERNQERKNWQAGKQTQLKAATAMADTQIKRATAQADTKAA